MCIKSQSEYRFNHESEYALVGGVFLTRQCVCVCMWVTSESNAYQQYFAHLYVHV